MVGIIWREMKLKAEEQDDDIERFTQGNFTTSPH